jgi:hypothetical protein
VRSVNPQRIARGIPRALLYDPVLNDPDYIVGAGADNRVFLGAFLELLLIIANIGTAVALFPILKRQNESVALGYVTARVVECAFIAVGILSVLSVVTLRQEAAGADAGSLVAVGKSLVAIKDWTFLLGPGFVVGVGNGLLLGYLMYRSGLVPRPMAVLGLVGILWCALRGSPCYSASSRQAPRGSSSRRSRRSLGSCRLASTSPSRDSGLLPSPPWMRRSRSLSRPVLSENESNPIRRGIAHCLVSQGALRCNL